ncbi:MAG TPA: glycosyltransferase family 4 protein [Candidatus Nanoarchaeia archaeon]|nr:glycosyltransferase family 4 protein [Candidatus Nanoarchaeia archaeon]
MKIGLITTYFYPRVGGAENNCFYLAKELAKKHEVHVFTSHKSEFKHYEVIDRIHVHRSREIFRFGYYAAFYPGMLFQVLNTKLDVLHVHSFGFLWHDFIILMKKIFNPKLKLVITPHGPFMALDDYSLHARFYKKIVSFLEMSINKLYDVVVQVNPSQKDWLVDCGFNENNIRYLPNGISKDLFNKVDNSDIVKKYNLKNKIVLSFVGRLQEYKGIDQVIKILPKLNKKAVFIVFGFGEDRQRLSYISRKLKIEDRIIFLHGNDMVRNKVLKSSDIFLFPSRWEAFGIVVLEAMAFGNSVVSSRTEGGKFLVKENVNGFLFDFGNLNELESKLKLLIKNKGLKIKISKNNIKKSKEFLWENIAKDLEKLYR